MERHNFFFRANVHPYAERFYYIGRTFLCNEKMGLSGRQLHFASIQNRIPVNNLWIDIGELIWRIGVFHAVDNLHGQALS